MKFTLALLSSAMASTLAATEIPISEVAADSKFGLDILSKSRKLDGNGEGDETWIAGMALKFQGCHHISQWNPDAEDADDVRIETKRLAKFRLCPVDTCSSNKARGCNKGYGDYIVDMDDFLVSFLQNKEEVEATECESYLENSCNCGNADDQDACGQSCFKSAGMSQCIENDFQLNNYLECAQYQPNNERRRLDGNADDQDVEYYLGVFCSSQGGSVNLGMFTDDSCTNFADNSYGKSTFYQLEGTALPYSDESIVDNSCYSCEDENDGDDYGYGNEPKEICTDVYEVAGKCETGLSNYKSSVNVNACDYMSGIQTSSSSGIINSSAGNGNKVANGFIGVFSVAFVLLGSYTYYLKTKLDRGRINLSD